MSDNKRASYHLNRTTPRELPEPKAQEPEVDTVARSAGTKNDLYGPQFKHGNKFVGAARPWAKNRPLAKGGRRP